MTGVPDQQPMQIPPWWTDPTENVKDLAIGIQRTLDSAMKRQDDLREMESRHIREMMELDRVHAKQLQSAEADRINAIQIRSDLTVQRAAEVQATQAQALAAQVATTADAFRSAMAAELSPVKASIEDLRRAQYEAQGQKTQVVETRGAINETRLNINLVFGIIAGAIAIITFILYITKK